MNNDSNIQHPSTPHPTCPQPVILISDSPQSVTSESVAPQAQSVAPQAQSVAPQSDSPLTQAVQGLSERALWAIGQNGLPGDVVVEMQGASITRANIRRLLNGQPCEDMMIDDEIINFWFARLMERANARGSKLPKTHCYSTNWTKSNSRYSWGRNIKLFDMELVLFPIHLESLHHWALVAVFPKLKKVVYYDSLGRQNHNRLIDIRDFFRTRYQSLTGEASDESEWTLSHEPNVPRQHNGIDCGVFVCQMAERLSRSQPIRL